MLSKSCPKESGIDSQPKRPRRQSSQVGLWEVDAPEAPEGTGAVFRPSIPSVVLTSEDPVEIAVR